MKISYVDHSFGMGHTIEAVVRLHNRHDLSRDIIASLVGIFNQVNRDARPPKLGQTVKVPVYMPGNRKCP
jgi:hypothetical protein